MINPMNSNYRGYMQANQSVVEESDEDEENGGREDIDLEAGRSTIFHSSHEAKPSPHSLGKRRVSWDPGASEMNVLHPNIHKEDKIHEHDSSDDEVPPSFMVEAVSRPIASPKFTSQPLKSEPRRSQALYSTSGRQLPPTLPSAAKQSTSPVQIPPPPLPYDDEEISVRHPRVSTPSQGSSSSSRQPRNTMRGLDNYEKALWNWVNVYNLDAFLQEVYSYYEGKGIYCIALSRGLNLLSVKLFLLSTHSTKFELVERLALLLGFLLSY
jgi:autophagy-related protein 9